jgi:hypothetical protein
MPVNFFRAVVVLAYFGIGSSALATTAPLDANGGTNETLSNAISEYCINARGIADDAARHVLRAPYQPRDMDAGSGPIHEKLVRIYERGGPLYERHVGLVTLASSPTLLVFRAASRSAPVVECRFNSVSEDIADMGAHLRATFALPEAVHEEDSNDWHTTGRTSLQGRSISVYLNYSQRENDKVGAFTLTAVAANVDELLLQAMTAYCVSSNGTVDETAQRATHAPFGAIVAEPSEGAPYGRSIRLGMPGRGETKILLIAPSRSVPVSECRLTTSASDNLTDMIARLRASWALSEPTKDSDGFWQMTGRSDANGRSANVEVTYKLQENHVANFLHLHVSR